MTDFRIEYGDALKVAQGLPDNSVDVMVTDPPYCSGGFTEAQRRGAKRQGLRQVTENEWFKGDNMGTSGLVFLLRELCYEAVRVVRNTGHLIVFCDWRMKSTSQPAIESVGVRYQNLLVWDKKSMGLGIGFRPQHELALHFTLGSPKYFSKSSSNVLKHSRVSPKNRSHDAQKPVSLIRHIIRTTAPPEGVVFDPFTGSGSHGEAAVLEGCSFIGAERDQSFVQDAKQRIAIAKRINDNEG